MVRAIAPLLSVIAAFGPLLSFASSAEAQGFAHRKFVLPQGGFELTGEKPRPTLLALNLSQNQVLKPISIHPHLYWGASDAVTVGITHERGLCFNECGHPAYDDVGLGLLVWLTGSPSFELDLHVQVPISHFDPFTVGVNAGVLSNIHLGRHSMVIDPHLYIGLTQRDAGNREQLVLPLWFYFQANASVTPFVGTALRGPLDGFGEAFGIPLEGGVVFGASRDIDLGFVLGFDNLLGRNGTLDARYAGFVASFRF